MSAASLNNICPRYRALLRAGLATALVYRAEYLLWTLTINLPLVNLALWSAVAGEAPVQGWSQRHFAAYFLAALLVRSLTTCGVVWEMTQEIKQGTMSLRLMRPVHPLLAYSAEALSPLPIRLVNSIPVTLALLFFAAPHHLTHDPLIWLAVPVLILGVWALFFLVMSLIGSLAFFFDSAVSVWNLFFGFYTVLSGYIVPVDLFPVWLQQAVRWMPFRLMLALPVEAMTGRLARAEVLQGLSLQLAWIGLLLLAVRTAFRAGVRRYAAFGG